MKDWSNSKLGSFSAAGFLWRGDTAIEAARFGMRVYQEIIRFGQLRFWHVCFPLPLFSLQYDKSLKKASYLSLVSMCWRWMITLTKWKDIPLIFHPQIIWERCLLIIPKKTPKTIKHPSKKHIQEHPSKKYKKTYSKKIFPTKSFQTILPTTKMSSSKNGHSNLLPLEGSLTVGEAGGPESKTPELPTTAELPRSWWRGSCWDFFGKQKNVGGLP